MALDKFAAGELIKKRREERGLTQEQVVEATSVPVAAYLSELENGKVNIARSKHFSSLATFLRLSQEDIRAINPSAVITIAAPDQQQPKLEPRPLPLPDGLRAAIDLYGKRFADLRDPRWQTYLAGFNWREGLPEDPEAWLDLYRDLTRAGIEPGGN